MFLTTEKPLRLVGKVSTFLKMSPFLSLNPHLLPVSTLQNVKDTRCIPKQKKTINGKVGN